MREILFRGKSVDNGAWIYGALLPLLEGRAIIANGNYTYVEVIIPETMGQYTGLTDKNGAKIFEGDIVRCAMQWAGLPKTKIICRVWYGEGCFAANQYPINNWLYDGKNGNIKLYDVEVIGNIHDNPELLEGGGAG